jgi:hypothetical protein
VRQGQLGNRALSVRDQRERRPQWLGTPVKWIARRPLFIGIQMFVRDKGLIWERTEKVDANHDLVRIFEILDQDNPSADSTDWSGAPGRIGADAERTGPCSCPKRDPSPIGNEGFRDELGIFG